MVVYGDPSYEDTLDALLLRLRARLSTVVRNEEPSLDSLRTLVIQAGQLEQAAEDGLAAHIAPAAARPILARLRTATDGAAAVFYARWEMSAGGAMGGRRDVGQALEGMERALSHIDPAPDAPLTVKIPEGFAFYALYPEQYCVSARRWMAEQGKPGSRPVVVAGIRSIGTTLSAAVAACLAAAGWRVHRLTVRPEGHPFSRRVEIDLGAIDRGAWALVVDEGPGQSGSSMAAAAEALARAGIERAAIGFLPSHAGGPGGAASPEARAWWSRASIYATPLADLRWEGQPLPDALAAWSTGVSGTGEPFDRVEDVGGGMWRRAAYSRTEDWPAVCTPFERTKYRCTAPSGASVLWKFAGLAGVDDSGESAAERTFAQLTERAGAGWAPAPLGIAAGFVALPWVAGVPLTRDDADPELMARIGRYLVEVAGPPLSASEQEAGLARLREMLYWNTWEVLGEETAARTRPWSERAVELGQGLRVPGAGDGRLAPHEWRRTPAGDLLKLDSTGHETDHTMVGRQPLLWDVAGAMLEWRLEPAAAAPLLAAVRQAAGLDFPPDLLRFYRMAYAAFRMGQCSLCAGMSAYDPEEQERLWRAAACYREELVRGLDSEA